MSRLGHQELEALEQNAHHLVRLTVQNKHCTERIGHFTQGFLPVLPGQYDHLGSALDALRIHEGTPSRRAYSEHVEESGRYPRPGKRDGPFRSLEAEERGTKGLDGRQRLAALVVVGPARKGNGEGTGRLLIGLTLLQDDHALGLMERERPKKEGAHHAEHGGVTGDRQGERDNREEGDQKAFPQRAYRETKVLKERAHHPPPFGRVIGSTDELG